MLSHLAKNTFSHNFATGVQHKWSGTQRKSISSWVFARMSTDRHYAHRERLLRVCGGYLCKTWVVAETELGRAFWNFSWMLCKRSAPRWDHSLLLWTTSNFWERSKLLTPFWRVSANRNGDVALKPLEGKSKVGIFRHLKSSFLNFFFEMRCRISNNFVLKTKQSSKRVLTPNRELSKEPIGPKISLKNGFSSRS
jgi:hypothetical protein